MTIERVTCRSASDHGLDEIVAKAAYIHLERMDHNHIWMVVTDKAGETVTVNLTAKGTIKAHVDRASVGKSGE